MNLTKQGARGSAGITLLLVWSSALVAALLFSRCGPEVEHGVEHATVRTVAEEAQQRFARQVAEDEMKRDSHIVQQKIEEKYRAELPHDPKLSEHGYAERYKDQLKDDAQECLSKKILEAGVNEGEKYVPVPDELKKKLENCLDSTEPKDQQ
jgi:acyl-CoA thioesterase FadM